MDLSYAERLQQSPTLQGFDAFANNIRGHLGQLLPRESYYARKAVKVLKLGDKIAELNDLALKLELETYRAIAACNNLSGEKLIMATALVSEAAARSMKMKPYKVQVTAVLCLQDGCISEMATGEGKSLTAAITAVLIGFKGRGCHVMTSNSYLACRDAEEFTPLFTFCGLSVASLDEECQGDDRRLAYRADITYCTNKDVAADFLRDQIRMGTKQTSGRVLLNNIHKETKVVEPTLRGLEFAIVDEIDSVMIDDGVTPLLISSEGSQKEDVAMYCKARDTAATLTKKHYKDPAGVSILLTPLGKSHLAKVFATTGGPWAYKRRREELIIQALKALHIFHKDKQYIIDEEKIVIVDQATGRTMPDRTWRNGMHQAIEAKENLEISPPKDTCARISFQKFFKLYRSLCGMTGTASEAGSEFYDYYLMPVVKIPTNRPCLRKFIGHTITNTENKKWEKVAEEIQQWHKKKRPILVGTASIKDSELLSEQLNKLAIAHQVLNAKNHLEESDIIKQAGIAGKITVATSMAGRGTDIKLSAESKKAGGLLVITTQLYHSKRVDRQLFGRCSRQGDPGSVKCFYSLEDDILKQHLGVLRHLLLPLSFLPDALLLTFFKMAQKISSSKSRKQRKSVLKSDDWLDDMLGFTGEGY